MDTMILEIPIPTADGFWLFWLACCLINTLLACWSIIDTDLQYSNRTAWRITDGVYDRVDPSRCGPSSLRAWLMVFAGPLLWILLGTMVWWSRRE